MKKILEGKTIVVTGTARGIGREMAAVFAGHGANVFAHARRQNDEHTARCRELESEYSVRVLPVYFDLTDPEQIKNAVKEIRGYKLTIDGLVNNAGVTNNSLFQMTGMDEVRNQMEANFFGPYLLTQYISKLMVRGKKGSIVGISSTAALDGNSGKSAYGASKAALLAMTLSISEELAASGIRANVICPGVTDTAMLETMPDYIMDIQKKATFLGTVGKPLDIANAAAYLLSDYASYITGQVIRVDGGVTQYEKRQ